MSFIVLSITNQKANKLIASLGRKEMRMLASEA